MAAGKGKSDQEISLPCQRVGAHINRWGWVDHFQFSLTLSLTHMHAHTDTCTQGETVPLSYHKYSSCQGVPHGLGTRLTGWSWLPSIWLHTHTYQGVLLLLSEPEHCCCPPHGPPQPPPVFSMSASQTSPPERRRRTDTHYIIYVHHFLGKVTEHFVNT